MENRRAAAIHDLSGIGKCSLTVILPVLSAMGVETAVLPTAVLSRHTAFTDPVCRDLTDDLLCSAKHWKREGAEFEAIYSGFLGSARQIGMVSDIFELLKKKDTLILVDPVMGDHGRLYKTYTPEMAQGVRGLCRKADVIVPNMTEAFCLTGQPYREGPYAKPEIEELLCKLTALGPECVVLTGVWFEEREIGAACYRSGRISYSLYQKYPGSFHGTGDIFASVLLGGMMNGLSVAGAQALATEFVGRTIAETLRRGREPLMGVCFEACLPFLIEKIAEKP